MFIRRKPNKSGTFSIEVISKRGGKNLVVRRFGSSRDEAELRSFERKAQQWIDDQRGPRLPFSWEKDDVISDFMSTLSNSQVRVYGPELVTARCMTVSATMRLKTRCSAIWWCAACSPPVAS